MIAKRSDVQATIALPNGTLAKVSVYRDGDRVTVVGVARHETPAGASETVVRSSMTVETFEWYRGQAAATLERAKGTLAYNRLLGMVGLTDKDVTEAVTFDIRRAPPLPAPTRQPMRLKR